MRIKRWTLKLTFLCSEVRTMLTLCLICFFLFFYRVPFWRLHFADNKSLLIVCSCCRFYDFCTKSYVCDCLSSDVVIFCIHVHCQYKIYWARSLSSRKVNHYKCVLYIYIWCNSKMPSVLNKCTMSSICLVLFHLCCKGKVPRYINPGGRSPWTSVLCMEEHWGHRGHVASEPALKMVFPTRTYMAYPKNRCPVLL